MSKRWLLWLLVGLVVLLALGFGIGPFLAPLFKALVAIVVALASD